MQGRKPKPTRMKILAGNPGKRPLNNREPQPTVGKSKCPVWMSPKAKLAFRELSEVLCDELGVLTVADRKALELLCDAYSEYRDARDYVRKNGATYETHSVTGKDEEGVPVLTTVVRKRPQVDMASDAWKRVKGMLVEFGLTPSSRTRLVIDKEDKSPDKAESYF